VSPLEDVKPLLALLLNDDRTGVVGGARVVHFVVAQDGARGGDGGGGCQTAAELAEAVVAKFLVNAASSLKYNVTLVYRVCGNLT
jgi:hypothetical protein